MGSMIFSFCGLALTIVELEAFWVSLLSRNIKA